MEPVCAVTGGSGYLGSRIAASLAAAGWRVCSLARHAPAVPVEGVEHRRYDLAEDSPAPLGDVRALVHAAYRFGAVGSGRIDTVNLEGSRRLYEAARAAGVEVIVHVSSAAAYPGCRSTYGRTKLAIETATREHGGAVVRPGLVWGDEPGGVFGALRRAIATLPAVPVLVPDTSPLVLAHESDVAALVAHLVATPEPGATFLAASRTALPFSAIVRAIGRADGRSPRLVRIPWQAAWAALRAAELARVRLPFRSDSLVSLARANPAPFGGGVRSPEELGVEFRPFGAGR